METKPFGKQLANFIESLNNESIKISNPQFDSIIGDFQFYFLNQQKNNFLEKLRNIKSDIIVIDEYTDPKVNQYLIICFDKTLIIISISDLFLIKSFFDNNKESNVYIISKKIDFNILADFQFKNIISSPDDFFQKLIEEFTNNINFQICNTKSSSNWNIMKRCISGYLIIKSNFRSRIDRIKNCKKILKSDIQEMIIDKNDFITLTVLGSGYSEVDLIYHIKEQKLYAIKQMDNSEDKLFIREYHNYLNIRHPFLCKFIGLSTYDSSRHLVFEYIDGLTLLKIKQLKLTVKEKIKIIFEIMISIEYLHNNNFIYRDLKPNNVMINQDKSAILIDFDRMIEKTKSYDIEKATKDFNCFFAPHELYENGDFTNKVDIYSIGAMIYFIICEKIPQIIYKGKNNVISYEDCFPKEFSNLKEIFEKCIQFDPTKRPNISELINLFYLNCFSQFFTNLIESDTIRSNENIHCNDQFYPYWIFLAENENSYSLYKLGKLYYKGNKLPKNIDKSIHYFKIAFDHKFEKASLCLGDAYFNMIPRDVKKSIYYFTKAAEQNDPMAQHGLGFLYLDESNPQRDINKSIYYFTLSADQNNVDSQFNLGSIFYEGKYVQRDINKAIKYYSLAAKQNHIDAQINLGMIFYDGKYVQRNANESIKYFKLAADQNDVKSQNNLGYIFLNDEYVKDINLAIKYFKLAADQKSVLAQYNLGVLFYKGKYITRDINKAIKYLKLAADQDDNDAQYMLGNIFYKGKYISTEINKAIYYYSLSAKKNDPKSLCKLGNIYLQYENDENKAYYYYIRAAELNNQLAQYNIGVMFYKYGHMNESIHYLKLAAENNNENAQLILGILFHDGDRVAKNIKESIKYFSMAAKSGNPAAQYYIGRIYYEGKYVVRDINKSLYYFHLSANQSYARSNTLLGDIYYYGDCIERDVKKAIHYYELAANQKETISLNQLGRIYLEGIYVKQNIQKAIEYFTEAASLKYRAALYNLGQIYHIEKFGHFDIKKAIYYYTISANMGYSLAQFNLAVIYRNGDYIKRDMNKAVNYYLLAANELEEAQFHLGLLYSTGIEVEKNIERAIHFYKQASSLNNQYAKNNLAIIYKNEKIGYSIELFNEAINKKNDMVCMYNLAHIYFYGKYVQADLDKSIKLLIMSSNKNFNPSKNLLSLALMKKNSNSISIKMIDLELKKHGNENKKLAQEIYNIIKKLHLDNDFYYNSEYENYEQEDYVYIGSMKPVPSKFIIKEFNEKNQIRKTNKTDITNKENHYFYDGFNN